MHALPDDVLADTGQAVEDDGPLAAVDVVDAVAEEGGTQTHWDGPLDELVNEGSWD